MDIGLPIDIATSSAVAKVGADWSLLLYSVFIMIAIYTGFRLGFLIFEL